MKDKEFESIVEKTKRLVFSAIFKYIHPSIKDLADDIAQETYYLAYRYISKNVKSIENIKVYLYKIAMNETLRVNSREQKEVSKYKKEQISTELLNLDEMQEIEDRIKQLPQSYLDVVLLLLQGFRLNDIAKALNIKLGTVKSRLFRAKKQLRTEV